MNTLYKTLAFLVMAAAVSQATAQTTAVLSTQGTLTSGNIIITGSTATVLYSQQTGTTGVVRGIAPSVLFSSVGFGVTGTDATLRGTFTATGGLVSTTAQINGLLGVAGATSSTSALRVNASSGVTGSTVWGLWVGTPTTGTSRGGAYIDGVLSVGVAAPTMTNGNSITTTGAVNAGSFRHSSSDILTAVSNTVYLATGSNWTGVSMTTPLTVNNALTLSQPVSTTGTPSILTVTGGAHTTLAASTELSDVVFNLNRNVQFTAGTLTQNRSFIINAPTLGFSSASSLTTASTVYISGPPIEGTNATVNRAYGLHIDASAATTATQGIGLAVMSQGSSTNFGAGFFSGRVSVGQAPTAASFPGTFSVDVYQYGGNGIGLYNNGVALGSWAVGGGGSGSLMQLYGAAGTLATQIGRGDNYFNADMAAINILMSGDTTTNLLVVNGTTDRVGVAITTNTPHSSFQTGGSFATNLRATAASSNITATDHVVTGTGAITLTLPTAVSITGREYVVKNIGGDSITAASAGGTIDGVTTQTVVTGTGAMSSMKFKSDGTNWIITY